MPNKWDTFFLDIAKRTAAMSKDPSTQTGAVLVSPQKQIVSAGFNGFPRAMPDHHGFYHDREHKYSRIIHCEMNAILAAKTNLHGCTLYVWPFLTCDRCAVHVIQAGISRVVAPACPPDKADRWEATFIKARTYYSECGVRCEEVFDYE